MSNFWQRMGMWMVGEIEENPMKPRKRTPKQAATKPHRDKTKYTRKGKANGNPRVQA